MLTVEGIEKVVKSEPSSASGSYRQVWFVGDVVVKRDERDGKVNRSEYENYMRLKPREGIHIHEVPQPPVWFRGGMRKRLGPDNVIKYIIRFPEMHMVGEYLVAERVKFPHPCAEYREKMGYRCAEDSCPDCFAMHHITDIASDLGIWDMHGENYCYDAETKTAYLIDLQVI